MAYSLQVTVDARDPHTLADWWAETLGWEVEPSDEAFIRSMVDAGHATEADVTTHRGVLVWKIGSAIKAPAGTDAVGRPRILFQRSEDSAIKSGKNRVHWDVNLGGESKNEVRSRLEARGATFLWEASQGPYAWITMADPEGNEFCIS